MGAHRGRDGAGRTLASRHNDHRGGDRRRDWPLHSAHRPPVSLPVVRVLAQHDLQRKLVIMDDRDDAGRELLYEEVVEAGEGPAHRNTEIREGTAYSGRRSRTVQRVVRRALACGDVAEPATFCRCNQPVCASCRCEICGTGTCRRCSVLSPSHERLCTPCARAHAADDRERQRAATWRFVLRFLGLSD